MTKATAKTNSAAAGYFEQVRDTISNFQSKIEVPAVARDFVPVSYTHLTLPTNREV